MKRFNFLAMLLPVFCCLFTWSANPACAESVTAQFTGVRGGNSGGVYTYPYDINVTPGGGGTSVDLSPTCVSYNQEIYLQNPRQTGTADVDTAGSLGSEYEEAAYLYTQSETNPCSGAANWAASALFVPGTLAGQDGFLSSQIDNTIANRDALNETGTLLSGAEGLSSSYLADYKFFMPVQNNEKPAEDGLSHTFSTSSIECPAPTPTPEPGSLLLLGTGLLGLATLIYSRRHSGVKSS